MRYAALLPLCLALPAPALAATSATVLIDARDGTGLATNVFGPADGHAAPTLLIRTPYGKDFIPMPLADWICDDLGYALVVQDTRGRGDSEGVDDVFMSDGWGENQDGWDTIQWITEQPFSNGEVGMVGASALGIAAYLAAGTLHPALKAMHVGITPSVFYDQAVYQGGVFREALVTDWLNGQGSGYMIDTYKAHPLYDELWESFDLRTRYPMMTVPILHWGGWYDIFAEGPVAAFEALQDGGPDGLAGPQLLFMGPWTHIDRGAWARVQGELTYPDNSLLPLGEMNPFAWFDRFLQPENSRLPGRDPFPVRFYLMGDVDDPGSAGNHWEKARGWPLEGHLERLYLQADGGLSADAPVGEVEPLIWVTDPADPLPTLGGRELSLPAGPRDQRPLQGRDDALVFQTPVLTEPLKVVGTVTADLWVASDAPDTDLSVRLVDVYPDGRAMLVVDGIRKARHRYSYSEEDFLTPGVVTPVQVEVGTTAIVFEPGHRIQIIVSSTNHRRFKVGGNNDGPVWGDDPMVPAVNSVFVDESFASSLNLPVPHHDASRPDVPVQAPHPVDVLSAQRRLHAGHPRPGDREILSQAAGDALLSAMMGTLPRF